jgi:hypothetical protein
MNCQPISTGSSSIQQHFFFMVSVEHGLTISSGSRHVSCGGVLFLATLAGRSSLRPETEFDTIRLWDDAGMKVIALSADEELLVLILLFAFVTLARLGSPSAMILFLLAGFWVLSAGPFWYRLCCCYDPHL